MNSQGNAIARPASNRLPSPIGLPFRFVSSPTRIRTWNTWLEARYDHPFHHQAISGRQGNRTLITLWRICLAGRPSEPVSGYLPFVCFVSGVTENRTRRVSRELGRHAIAVSSRWTITPTHQWTAGESNPDYLSANQVSFHWTSSPCCFIERSVRELNSAFLLTTQVCCRNTYRPFIESDPGWTRTTGTHAQRGSFLHVTQASSPLDHGINSSDRGGSRTHKIIRLST